MHDTRVSKGFNQQPSMGLKFNLQPSKRTHIVNRHRSSLILTVRRFADVSHLTIFPITAAQREQLKILKDLQTGKP